MHFSVFNGREIARMLAEYPFLRVESSPVEIIAEHSLLRMQAGCQQQQSPGTSNHQTKHFASPEHENFAEVLNGNVNHNPDKPEPEVFCKWISWEADRAKAVSAFQTSEN
ncbi:hypothetical protein HUU40_13465 [candidate division KSB1 bacterium]|nr:hypothetical protein [candidate division KSB1 bacterium]